MGACASHLSELRQVSIQLSQSFLMSAAAPPGQMISDVRADAGGSCREREGLTFIRHST